MVTEKKARAHFHLPGLFEFYDFYRAFLEVFTEYREFFYDWCDIGSIYGSPADCLWGGGRVELGETEPEDVFRFMQEYGISARLTLSNSLLKEEHLTDRRCNRLCSLLEKSNVPSGAIVYSELLMDYLKERYPRLYYVSSTTKCITDFEELRSELDREDYSFVVPDFRLNKCFDKLANLTEEQKKKVEFLCNECCNFGCVDRKRCYEEVSRKNLGENESDFRCTSPDSEKGYRFSKAMENPGFIGIDDIRNIYMPMGFTNFKIEGRGLGSALILEFLLYYMTKPEHRLKVREKIYLDSSLDLF